MDCIGDDGPAWRHCRHAEPVDGSHDGALRMRPGQPLLQGAVDGGELGVQGGAEPIDRCDDRQRNTRRDQAVFDRGCARFVRQEFLDEMLQLRLQISPPTSLGARTTTGQHLKLRKPGTRNLPVKSAATSVQI